MSIWDDYTQYCSELIKMSSEFEVMWNRYLVRTAATQNTIGLSSENASPIQSAPYQARAKVCETENNEMAEKTELEVIEWAQTEWELPVVLTPRRRVSSDFVQSRGSSTQIQYMI